MDDILKKLNELALSYAESHVSSHTEYLHFNYEAKEEGAKDTIPFVENFLYILALFKSRTVENMTKAKNLLEKLFVFQESQGNFPVYLHHYPECKDRYLSFQLLAPLYYILKDFSQIFSPQLKQQIESVLLKLLDYSLKMLDAHHPADFMRMLVASASFATGKLLNLSKYEKRGELILKEFKKLPKEAYEPRFNAHLIIASQMVDPSLKNSFIEGFYDHLTKCWHFSLKGYVGPAILEYQNGFEPEATFLDLFMGYLIKDFSERALKQGPSHLLLSLIQPVKDEVKMCSECLYEGQVLDNKFLLSHHDHFTTVFIEQDEIGLSKAFAPFKMCWGNKNRLHTFITQGGNSKKTTISKEKETYTFLFSLNELPELEDKEKSREVAFYFDLFENSQFTVEGIRATTFRLGEKLNFEVDGFKFTLLFEIKEGSGEFLGHYMRGNRPSQLRTKGKDRFSAFDSQIFLRTIRRDPECVIKATLEIL